MPAERPGMRRHMVILGAGILCGHRPLACLPSRSAAGPSALDQGAARGSGRRVAPGTRPRTGTPFPTFRVGRSVVPDAGIDLSRTHLARALSRGLSVRSRLTSAGQGAIDNGMLSVVSNEAVSRLRTPGARVRLTVDLSRYDERLTVGQVGTVKEGRAVLPAGRSWESATGTPFAHVVFDCGAALDVIAAKWRRPTKTKPGAWCPAGLELVEAAAV